MGKEQGIVLGVDQGTTNTKVVAVDPGGAVLAEASRPIASHAPELGWVEQDPEAMYRNVADCVREVLATTGRRTVDVLGLGVANQTETLVVWDGRSGKPLLPAIVWKCRRGSDEIQAVHEAGHATEIRRRTGLSLDPTFTAAKLAWVFANRPEIGDGLRRGDFLFGTVDCWLTWKLTDGAVYATDASNASRTMLCDIHAVGWDRELAGLFGLSLGRLPELRPSAGLFGRTAAGHFGAAIPITAALGDQQASLFGHGCFDAGEMKVTYGTGGFIWHNAGGRIDTSGADDGLIRTIAWQLDRPCYALEGFIMYAGAIFDWLASRLGLPGGGREVARRAEQAGSSGGVVLVPAFQGLAGPWWRPDAKAALFGMSEATEAGHICHAGLEALCYQVRVLLETIERATGGRVATVRVDGGPTRSAYLMQMQADTLQRPIAISGFDSMTPYGAALMAGLGAGLWSGIDELRRIAAGRQTVAPKPDAAAMWDDRYRDWLAATDAVIAMKSRREEPGPERLGTAEAHAG